MYCVLRDKFRSKQNNSEFNSLDLLNTRFDSCSYSHPEALNKDERRARERKNRVPQPGLDELCRLEREREEKVHCEMELP